MSHSNICYNTLTVELDKLVWNVLPLAAAWPPAGGAADLTPHCIQTVHHSVAQLAVAVAGIE